MKRLILLAVLFFIGLPAHAQTSIQSGPVNPTLCTPGALFYNTTTAAYQQCGPANTWSSSSSGGAGPASTYNVTISGSTITAASGLGLATVTGTDFDTVMNAAISNAANVCGVFTFGPGIFPMSTMTLQSGSTYYGIAIPPNAGSSTQYCQWKFIGSGATYSWGGGAGNIVQTKGTIFQATAAARTACGAGNFCNYWLALPDSTNQLGNDTTFENIGFQFVDNQRGNECAFCMFNASTVNFVNDNCGVPFWGAGASPTISPAVAGANRMICFQSAQAGRNNWQIFDRDYCEGADLCYDVYEHTGGRFSTAQLANQAIEFGRLASASVPVQNPSHWDRFVDEDNINGVLFANNMQNGTRVDFTDYDIEISGAPFARVSNFSENNPGFTSGIITYTILATGGVPALEVPPNNLFASGGQGYVGAAFDSTNPPNIAQFPAFDSGARPGGSATSWGAAWVGNGDVSICNQGSNNAIISSNGFTGNSSTGAGCYYAARGFGPSQFSMATVAAATTGNSVRVGVLQNTANSNFSRYEYLCSQSGDATFPKRTLRFINSGGTATTLASTASNSGCPNATDKLKLVNIQDDSGVNHLYAFYCASGVCGSVPDLTATDSNLTSGQPSLITVGTAANALAKNFTAGVPCGGVATVNDSVCAREAIFPTYNTLSNCTSSASPSVCGSASSGAVSILNPATSVVVDTTAVTANSNIQVMFDSSLSTRLGVTCTATNPGYTITARSPGVSFTITATPGANSACFTYWIVN